MGNQLFVIPLDRGSRQKSSRKWVFVSVWGNALLANEGARRAGFSFCSTVPALGGPAGTFVIRLGNGNAACCGLTTREPGQFSRLLPRRGRNRAPVAAPAIGVMLFSKSSLTVPNLRKVIHTSA